MSVIVIQFITVDGVAADPAGASGTPTGGWVLRHGREQIAGDKFGIADVLEDGAMLLGRATWQEFARIWPGRSGPFADRMNAARKLVVSRTGLDTSAWSNSTVVDGDPAAAVRKAEGDIVVLGSRSVVGALAAEDLVDEYRLLTFPEVVGTGDPFFPAGTAPVHLRCLSVEPSGVGFLTRYARTGA
ncbi:dihydrofolate reductase family protein [Streptomyces mangrovisoli]|uniref:Riboflavin biosynthesis protein RibD n=1 Tax=Streptomyces mangrovisoli TaxID=1428628 RepID=A0A1J4NY28_9ACTN|nr:dihydrofolate reductase family protein [Streptomyces mangrovisoli]OIJ66388.1 riboflavin biosynthesis protein RibD [Streptomyces mangrovisoli]